jgi:hypothetical protein
MLPQTKGRSACINPRFLSKTPALFLNDYPNSPKRKTSFMRDWLKTLIAGVAAYKWGGGCMGTILVFALVYWLLGHGCN